MSPAAAVACAALTTLRARRARALLGSPTGALLFCSASGAAAEHARIAACERDASWQRYEAELAVGAPVDWQLILDGA